jgi:hypothetical protein
METLVWLGIGAAIVFFMWIAAPHHQRIIDNRDTGARKGSD